MTKIEIEHLGSKGYERIVDYVSKSQHVYIGSLLERPILKISGGELDTKTSPPGYKNVVVSVTQPRPTRTKEIEKVVSEVDGLIRLLISSPQITFE